MEKYNITVCEAQVDDQIPERFLLNLKGKDKIVSKEDILEDILKNNPDHEVSSFFFNKHIFL